MVRSDAVRNRAEILVAARAVLAEQGTQASLRDVARRAGVGLGTLYRHFPTRDALLETLLHEGFANLVQLARTLPAEHEPLAALTEWLHRLADGATVYRGLPSSLLATLQDPGSALYASCAALHDAGAQLVHDAQRAGVLRHDVTGVDVFALVGSIASITDHGGSVGQRRDLLLRVAIDGLTVRPLV